MDCCMIGDWGGESPEFFSIKEHVARMVHTCCECGRTIEPGERYEYLTGYWSGRFITYKTCADCLQTGRTLSCGTWCCGALWDDIQSYIDTVACDESKIPWSKIAELPERSRNTILDMIEEQWEVWEECVA